MLDLGSKPFYLDEDGIRWVVSTRLAMSEEEKLRQLFCLITYSDDEEYCRRIGSSRRFYEPYYARRGMPPHGRTDEFVFKYSSACRRKS